MTNKQNKTNKKTKKQVQKSVKTKNTNVKKSVKNNSQEFVEIKLNKDSLLSPLQRIDNYYRKVLTAVDNFMKRELFVDINLKILLGVSGGVDSMTALDILANLSQDNKWELVVVHLDHSLREESADDAKFVENKCREYGVKYYIDRFKISKNALRKKLSIEEAARRARYNLFENIAKKENVNFVATAHNANDSAETFFINLIRGSGLTGLSGIPQKRSFFKNINIIRPIIFMSRKEILEYAEKRGIEWREDNTNKESKFDRNKIRNDLFPLMNEMFGKDIVKTTNRASAIINSADRFIHSKLSGKLQDIVVEASRNYVAIDARKLNLFEQFAKFELVSMVLNKYFRLFDLVNSTIKGILNLTFSDPGAKFKIDDQLIAYMDRDVIYIYKDVPKEKVNLKINKNGSFDLLDKSIKLTRVTKKLVELNDDPNVQFFDADSLSDDLLIRNAEDGDRFMPLGMHGTMKLSDFMINNKIPLIKKKDILVLCSADDIVWVIGERISEKFKVEDDSLRIIKAEITSK